MRRLLPAGDQLANREAWPRCWKATAGPLPQRCVRAIFRELLSGCRSLVRQIRGRLPRAAVQLQPPGGHPPLRPERRVRAGRHDRRRVRGGQPRPVRFRPGAGRELDRRPHRRHAGHVHPAAGADLRRGGDADPPHAAGQSARGPRSRRSTAGRRRSASAATGWPSTCRRPGPSKSPAPRRRPNWRRRSPARRPSPACRRASTTGWTCWPRTSRTTRATPPASP